MKSNIDLTENRDFRVKSSISNHGIFKFLGIKYLWDFREVNLESEYEVFLTGNKKERQSKLLHIKTESNRMCECCGRETPEWNMIYGLCQRCHDYHGFDYENIIKENTIWKHTKRGNN